MKQYLDALKQIIETGVDRGGRNGLTRALFGMQMRYDMAEWFPRCHNQKTCVQRGESGIAVVYKR